MSWHGFLTLLFSLHVRFVLANRTCYSPQGVERPDAPCDPSAENSACCGPNYICYSNGLCQPGPGAVNNGLTDYYRGSCTDPTWTAPECPNYCVSAQDNNEGGQGLNACPGDGPGKYCCWRAEGNCCSNVTAIINLGTSEIVTTIAIPASSSTPSSSATDSATPSVASTTPSATSTSDTDSSSGDKSTEIGIGVGLGVGISALLILLVCLVILRRRRHAPQPQAAGSDEKAELDVPTTGNGRYEIDDRRQVSELGGRPV